jgi:hypothetical protein
VLHEQLLALDRIGVRSAALRRAAGQDDHESGRADDERNAGQEAHPEREL